MMRLLSLRNALIVLALALVAALGYETDWGAALFNSNPGATRTPPGKHEIATVLPDFKLSSEASTYSQIVDKPLLNPSRKPAPTQIVQAATEPPKPQIRRGLYQLVGVTDLGDRRIAQVREMASSRVVSVREGDKLQEMTVAKIAATQVTLAFRGETDSVDLPKFTASGRAPVPVALPNSVAPTPTAPPQISPQTAAAIGMPMPLPSASALGNASVSPGMSVPPSRADIPQQPPRDVISVGEMLERRRLARQQSGGQ